MSEIITRLREEESALLSEVEARAAAAEPSFPVPVPFS
jgi:hypothetical protein